MGPATFNFHRISLLDRSTVEHTFVLENYGKLPVEVTKFLPSCGCTSVTVMDLAPLPDGSYGIPAGRSVHVKMTINLLLLAPGIAEKTVAVWVKGLDSPPITLEMFGDVSYGVEITPQDLVAGDVPYGTGYTTSVGVDTDRRLLLTNEDFALISTDPDVQIRKTEPDNLINDGNGKSIIHRVYRITVDKDHPVGPLFPHLALSLVARGSQLTAEQRRALIDTDLSMSGRIVGSEVALPSSVVLGSGSGSLEPSADVLIQSSAGAHLSISKISENDPRIVGTNATPTGVDLQPIIRIAIKPGAPKGHIYACILVTLGNSERLAIPVEAFVGSN
jgi:hypothetical protein